MGNSFGPDLTKLDPKWKPADILNEILTPSARINEKYQTNVFELGSGKVVTGLVLEETPETIKIIENPLAKAEPTVIRRGDVVERQRSKTSMMPKGLLDKLTRDEILDLVAYVAAGGKQDHGASAQTRTTTMSTPRPKSTRQARRATATGVKNGAMGPPIRATESHGRMPNRRRASHLSMLNAGPGLRTLLGRRSVGRVGDQDDRHFLVHRR